MNTERACGFAVQERVRVVSACPHAGPQGQPVRDGAGQIGGDEPAWLGPVSVRATCCCFQNVEMKQVPAALRTGGFGEGGAAAGTPTTGRLVRAPKAALSAAPAHTALGPAAGPRPRTRGGRPWQDAHSGSEEGLCQPELGSGRGSEDGLSAGGAVWGGAEGWDAGCSRTAVATDRGLRAA